MVSWEAFASTNAAHVTYSKCSGDGRATIYHLGRSRQGRGYLALHARHLERSCCVPCPIGVHWLLHPNMPRLLHREDSLSGARAAGETGRLGRKGRRLMHCMAGERLQIRAPLADAFLRASFIVVHHAGRPSGVTLCPRLPCRCSKTIKLL